MTLLVIATVLIAVGALGLGTLALAAKRYREAEDPLTAKRRAWTKGTKR